MAATRTMHDDRPSAMDTRRIRCVIVDDERRAREILRHLLTRYVPQADVVAEADSVGSALEAIRTKAPEVVFLDVEIIGGTGFDVLDAIDSRSFLAVFITAHENYRADAGRYLNTCFLAKPLEIEELQDAFRGLRPANE